MANKTYIYQTALEIKLNIGEDISTTVNRALIKFRKPNGFEGYWKAEIVDPVNGIISYSFPTSSKGLDDIGYWTFWAYLYYNDGSVTPGDPVQIGVFKQGKTYIAFPYGMQSGSQQEIEMAQEAFEILYDNTNSGLIGSNVQEAIDELDSSFNNVATPPATGIAYDGSISGLASTNVKTAIDEIDADLDIIQALIGQANQVVYVDVNRVDTYVQDGTINRPYKTIVAAIASVSSSAVIKVSVGTYSTNLALPANTSLIGMGVGKTIIDGTITTSATGNCSLKEFTCLGAIIIQGDTVVTNVNSGVNGLGSGSAVNIGGNLRAYNFNIVSGVGDFNSLHVSAGLVMIENSIISTASTTKSAVNHAGGNLILESIEADSNSSDSTVKSIGGSLRVLSSRVSNLGAGDAINISNAAASTMPNVLSNVIQIGGIATGTSYTVLDGISGDDPVGTNYSRRPATQLGYDGTYSELPSGDLQAALDAIYGSCKSGAGAPSSSPINSIEFYYDYSNNDLYIWNSSVWRKITTTSV